MNKEQHTAALLLGSNVGERPGYLERAIKLITEKAGRLVANSSLFETAPWGNTAQRSFLNQAILIQTILPPMELLQTLLDIEIELGRKRIEKWGPRIIDIDILYYDQLEVNQDHLKIPHPFLQERRFSLVPLHEISPDWVHPRLQKTVSQMLEDCQDEGEVTIYRADKED
jgi:2-amino-4-hydroxy-6-hydroxymethyldihydropteridine diphosphokinase